MSEHVHTYQYLGLVFNQRDHPLPGSGAHETVISEKYYCSGCLQTEYRDTGGRGNTYYKKGEHGGHFDAAAPPRRGEKR